MLSCDELTRYLFDNNLGDKHDEMSKKIWEYLLKKSVDIVNTGTNVILDWGFWSKKDREFIKAYFIENKVFVEWHYINIDDNSWQKNITERNNKVLKDKNSFDYYIDEGLKNKFLSKWQEPNKCDIDVWYNLVR